MTNKFKVLTVRDVKFKDDKDRQIEGMQLWLLGQTNEPGWNGYEVLKIWVDVSSPLALDVHQLRHGDQVQIDFNRRGKAAMITLL